VAFVYGPSGAGKTVLISKVSFNFAKEGRRVLWVTFNEGRDTLHETWRSFGWKAEEIVVYDYPFVPQYRETLFNQVVDLAYKERAEVFVIDGVEAIVFRPRLGGCLDQDRPLQHHRHRDEVQPAWRHLRRVHKDGG